MTTIIITHFRVELSTEEIPVVLMDNVIERHAQDVHLKHTTIHNQNQNQNQNNNNNNNNNNNDNDDNDNR